MLNNITICSLIISSLSTTILYFTTNRSNETKESLYKNQDLMIIFSIIFGTSLLLNYVSKKSKVGINNNQPDNTLNPSRPPF